jgi:hypothetical protein
VILREGQLEFNFTGCLAATKLDESGTPMPETMRKVDFLVEETDRVLLIEVKDPSDTRAAERGKSDFIQSYKGRKLVNETLVPKCRDSYTYLHLMEESIKPLLYVVVISIYEHVPKRELFTGLTETLRVRLRKEGKRPWKRQYVKDCLVLNVAGWNQKFPYVATQGPADEHRPAKNCRTWICGCLV